MADRLWLCAAGLLAVIPLAMEVAHRSSPLVITLAAAAAVAAVFAEEGARAFAQDVKGALLSPVGVASVASLAWALLSVLWSRQPGTALHAWGEFVLPLGATLALALRLPARTPRVAWWLLLACAGLACILILAELRTGLKFRRDMGLRWNSYIFNRPALTLLVLLVPLLRMVALRQSRPVVVASAAVAVLAAAVIGACESGAAVLGLLVGGGAYVLARIAPKVALALAAGGFILVFALAPVLGDLAQRMLPPSLHERLAQSHSRERVDIWRSFGAAARQEPLKGAGFGMSARLDQAPVAAQVPPELRSQLEVGHPHNAALQVWTELGAVGAILALAVLLLMLRSLARLPPEKLAPRMALVAASAAVSLVGHGAWQGWWPAAIGAAVVWLRIAEEETVR